MINNCNQIQKLAKLIKKNIMKIISVLLLPNWFVILHLILKCLQNTKWCSQLPLTIYQAASLAIFKIFRKHSKNQERKIWTKTYLILNETITLRVHIQLFAILTNIKTTFIQIKRISLELLVKTYLSM